MKRMINKGMWGLSLVFALMACNPDTDLFDQSATDRLEEAKNELQQTLMSSPQGWEFVYFTDSLSYGGYNMLMSFTNKEVTVRGGKFFSNKTSVSPYEIGFPQSMALMFTGYNEVFSVLGDPDENDLTGSGSALGGENVLLWMRTSENGDTIEFKSQNSNTRSKMYRHQGSWDDHVAKVDKMIENFSGGAMNRYFREMTTADGESLLFTGFDNLTRTLSPLRLQGDSVVVETNGVAPTEYGFQFTKPVNFNGHKVDRLAYNEENGKFNVLENGVMVGEMISVDEPSFVFSGKNGMPLNTMVFEPKVMYSISGASEAILTPLDSVLMKSYRVLDEQYDVWSDYYGLMFYPMTTQSGEHVYHSLWMMFLNKGDDPDSDEDDFLDIIAGVDNFSGVVDQDASRTDKVVLTRPRFNMWQYRCYEDPAKGHNLFASDPEIKTYLQKALEALVTTASGTPYIIIPSTGFTSFTLGSTLSNDYFIMSYVRKFE